MSLQTSDLVGKKWLFSEETFDPGSKLGNYIDQNYVILANQTKNKLYADLTSKANNYVGTHGMSLHSSATSLNDFLMRNAETRQECAEELRWSLYAKGNSYTKAGPNLCPDVEFLGIEQAVFQIHIDCGVFREGDVLAPNIDWNCQVRLCNDGTPGAAGYYKYDVQLVTQNPMDFFPQKYLQEGLKWTRVGSFYGEATGKAGSFHYESATSKLSFSVRTSKMRKELKVTDKAMLTDARMISMHCLDKSKDGKDMVKQVIPRAYLELNHAFESEKAFSMYYGKGSRGLVDSSSGYEVEMGPGLECFIEDSNVINYNPFKSGIGSIVDNIQKRFQGRQAYGNRDVIVMGGSQFIKWWIEGLHLKYGHLLVAAPENFSIRSRTDGNKSIPGGQFGELEARTHYITRDLLYPGGSVSVEHFPFFDDTTRGKGLQINGWPASSYQGFIIDLGGKGANKNIIITECDRAKGASVVCGMWGPDGIIKGGLNGKRGMFYSSHHRDEWSVVRQERWGIIVKDASKMIFLNPNLVR